MGRLAVNIGKQIFVRVGKSDGTEVLDRQQVRHSLHYAEIMMLERVDDRYVGTRLDTARFRHGKALIAIKSEGAPGKRAVEGQEFNARIAGALGAGPQPYPLRSSTILLLSHMEPVGGQRRKNEEIRRRPQQRRHIPLRDREF